MTTNNKLTANTNTLSAFNKFAYKHEELLTEMLRLEAEASCMISGTADKTFAETAGYFHDIIEADLDIVPRGKIKKFYTLSSTMEHRKRGLQSAEQGQIILHECMEIVRENGVFLEDIELSVDGKSSVFNGIYITQKAVYVLDATNTLGSIYISPQGQLYIDKKGNQLCAGNIMNKLEKKQYLLKSILQHNGLDLPVVPILVFTNPSVTSIQCESRAIRYCFADMLSFMLRSLDEQEPIRMDQDQLDFAARVILDANEHHEYSYGKLQYEVECYKCLLAELVYAVHALMA